MKGIFRKVEKKDFEIKKGDKKGQKFSKIEFTVDCIDAKGRVETLQGSYSMDFAKKYFAHVATIHEGKKMADFLGQEVEVVTEKKSYEKKDNAGTGVYKYVKYMNILDAEGKAIKLPFDNVDANSFDF